MKRNIFLYFIALLIVTSMISGCGTAPKKVQTEVTGIKTRVETLEARVEGVEVKQAEAERAVAEQAQALEELKSVTPSAAKTNFEVKPREGVSVKVKDIQRALKNAGYYDGKVDGVKGKNTRRAIRDFQSANGLKADGIVGSKTWELLSRYLEAAAPAAAAATSEDEGIK